MNDWHTGMRLVCIKNFNRNGLGQPIEPHIRLPEKGRIYTLADMFSYGTIGVITLQELPVQYVVYSGIKVMVRFDARAFKPVDESRLDVFRAMLRTKPVSVDALVW